MMMMMKQRELMTFVACVVFVPRILLRRTFLSGEKKGKKVLHALEKAIFCSSVVLEKVFKETRTNATLTTTNKKHQVLLLRVLKFLNISTHLALVAFTFTRASSSSRREKKQPRNLETNRSGCQRNISERRSLTAHDLE